MPGNTISHHICMLLRPAFEQRAPAWVGRRGAEAEEAQGAFDEDRRGDAERDRHEHRGQRVAEDVAEHDAAACPTPMRPGGGDEVHFAEPDELAAREPGDAGPTGARRARPSGARSSACSSIANSARISTSDGMHITSFDHAAEQHVDPAAEVAGQRADR